MHWTSGERCVLLGQYIIDKKATVRAAAKAFGVSKSTVHKDVTERLRQIDRILYIEVKKVLEENKTERHMRGGLATKRKYELISEILKKNKVYCFRVRTCRYVGGKPYESKKFSAIKSKKV